MDFRLNNEIDRWTKESDLFNGFDVISVAGASKSLVDGGEEVRNNFLKHIGVSVNLHKARKIVILHHSNCGAYAADYKFSSAGEEKEKQVEDMGKSREIILAKYPDIDIILAWGELKDSEGKKIEFEIVLN